MYRYISKKRGFQSCEGEEYTGKENDLVSSRRTPLSIVTKRIVFDFV